MANTRISLAFQGDRPGLAGLRLFPPARDHGFFKALKPQAVCGSLPSGLALSAASGSWCANTSETWSIGILYLAASCRTTSLPSTCFNWSADIGRFWPVPTQDLAISPRPDCCSLATMALRPPCPPLPITSPSTAGSTAAPSWPRMPELSSESRIPMAILSFCADDQFDARRYDCVRRLPSSRARSHCLELLDDERFCQSCPGPFREGR